MRCARWERAGRSTRVLRRFITTCLLAFVAIVTTQGAQVQDGPSTSTGNQKPVTSTARPDDPETKLGSNAQSVRTPLKQSRLFTRVGLLVAPYHSSATIATNGQLLSGGTAKVSNNMSVTFDLGYEISRNFSVSRRAFRSSRMSRARARRHHWAYWEKFAMGL